MRILILILFLLPGSVSSQVFHMDVFPEVENDETLYDLLVQEYKTSSVLSYSEARDTFMSLIDAVDNELSCIYTGYTITLDPTADPTTDAFNQNINTEHSYPRSKGALEGTPGYSDMHHLYPTRVNVNADRGDLPYGEVTDIATDKWYRDDVVMTGTPSTNIDEYSELLEAETFEPREDMKGDLARAMFYFRTMYRLRTEIDDAEFFDRQVEDLCLWHAVDPVDEKEWNRNWAIASYQAGKPNPFVLDCRLARMYCEELSQACLTVDVKEVQTESLPIYPNPAQDRLNIDFSGKGTYYIYNAGGILSAQEKIDRTTQDIDISRLSSGMHTLIVRYKTGKTSHHKFIKR